MFPYVVVPYEGQYWWHLICRERERENTLCIFIFQVDKSTYLVLLLEIGHHDDGGCILLPYHAPEVWESGGNWTLRGYVPVGTGRPGSRRQKVRYHWYAMHEKVKSKGLQETHINEGRIDVVCCLGETEPHENDRLGNNRENTSSTNFLPSKSRLDTRT